MRRTNKYVFFWGKGSFTNWCMCHFVVDGIEYNCTEQYMMAEKARLFGDIEILSEIMASEDPSYQKLCGRKVRGFVKEKWDAVARDVMYRGCRAKFEQNPAYLKELMDTGDRTIVEASPYDCIWGIGLHWTSPLCNDPAQWGGTNWLGETLTKVRDDICREREIS